MKKAIVLLLSLLMIGGSFAYTPAMEAKINAVVLTKDEQDLVSRITNIVGPNIDKYGEKYRQKVLRILGNIEKKSSNVRMKATVREMISYSEDYGITEEETDIGSIGNLIEQSVSETGTTNTGTNETNVVTPSVDYNKLSWDAINDDSDVLDHLFQRNEATFLKLGIVEDDRILVKFTEQANIVWSWTYKIDTSCNVSTLIGKKVLIGRLNDERILFAPDGKGDYIKCNLTEETALRNLNLSTRAQDQAWLNQNGYSNSLR